VPPGVVRSFGGWRGKRDLLVYEYYGTIRFGLDVYEYLLQIVPKGTHELTLVAIGVNSQDGVIFMLGQ